MRHIHATPEDAERMGLKNGEIVSVEIPTANSRNLTFGDVVVRVSEKYALAMHMTRMRQMPQAWLRTQSAELLNKN